jgi:uncharacterized protein YfdQ (DUF2303 family)
MADATRTTVTGPAGHTDSDALIGVAMDAAMPQPVERGELVVARDPRGVVLDLERYADTPRRKRGSVLLDDTAALIAYVNKHEEDTGTELFASIDEGRIWAVLNGHGNTTTGWGDHRAVLKLRPTPAWLRWTEYRNGHLMAQTAFAEHIEESLPEIVEPPAADMLELAQSFQAQTSVSFRSARRLTSGETQLRYEEQTDAKAGAQGELTIPQTFTLALVPWEGCDAYRLTARLRYRIGGGNLQLGYVLDRPEDVKRAAFADITATLAEETGYTPMAGSPPTGVAPS